MFTGIVEHLGTIESISETDASESGGNGFSILVQAAPILDDATLGDSISVNGTCLTITEFSSTTCKFGVSPETLRRTSLGALKAGSRVNLERACKASTRMGGHLVQGHVDSTATITSRKQDGNAITLSFKPQDKTILKYVVEKGYICLDGASLTVTEVNEEGWSVMLVAYTQGKITLGVKGEGEVVNVEVDQVGKYVEKMVLPYLGSLKSKV